MSHAQHVHLWYTCYETMKLGQVCRLNHVTGDRQELTYLFQRLSIAIQRDNELCFNGTFAPR